MERRLVDRDVCEVCDIRTYIDESCLYLVMFHMFINVSMISMQPIFDHHDSVHHPFCLPGSQKGVSMAGVDLGGQKPNILETVWLGKQLAKQRNMLL